MKSALSIALVAGFWLSAVPATAQAPMAAPADPLARGVARHALRLAAAGDAAIARQRDAQGSEWGRVRKLAPGTEIVLTVRDSAPAQRYFVAGSESELTVLNVADRSLSVAARRVLRDVASSHPDYLLAARLVGGTFMFEKDVRVAPDGVFVAGRRVADLAHVVEQVGRDEIVALGTAAVERNAAGCAIAGYYGGALVGGLPGAVIGGAVGRDTGPALLGMMVGWSTGAVHVYGRCRHTPERLLYGAP